MSKVYIFYNNKTLEVITILQPILDNIDLEDFKIGRIKYDNKCKNLTVKDIDYIVEDAQNYEKNININGVRTNIYIDHYTKKLKYGVIEDKYSGFNCTYNTQTYKRDYTIENINDMYNNDYINFNLKNLIKSDNDIIVEFKLLSDIKIRTSMMVKRWKGFYTDPYLEETAHDKFILGRSIIKDGTYYPIIVCRLNDSNNDLYVLEGSHRIMSLKLLQNTGEIPEDFKILCIEVPFTYEDRRSSKIQGVLINEPIQFRNIIEVGFGQSILINDDIYKKAIEFMTMNNQKIINPYTYEYTAYTWADVLSGIDLYPHWLRDLIYNNGNIIMPSKIINDEQTFKDWVRG